MTRGVWKFVVDQPRLRNISISNLPSSKMVLLKQQSSSFTEPEQKIYVDKENLDELIDALRSAKRWST